MNVSVSRLLGASLFMLSIAGPAIAQEAPQKSSSSSNTADWESLAKDRDPAPQWFRDDKFGIYFHWGVYSVPAFGSEWYPCRMHEPGHAMHRHHIEKYGSLDEYGYEKFVDDFKAEKFDADQWCDLFQKSGAKFVGPVAEHHDGYAMWDSQLTPWNSVDTGPHRDIVGEMAAAVRKRGMKFVATFHHARNRLWEVKPGKWEGHYKFAKEHFPEVFENNPERSFLYGHMPKDQFLEMWNGKLKEVIDNYQPDLIWFDSWLHEIPEENQFQFASYYISESAKRGQDVVITYKQKDLPQTVGVLDIEKGGLETITDFAWLTDDTISKGSWCYTESLTVKPTKVVLHSLIDIVSKNGQLILNVSPKADGTIPLNQQETLLGVGDWLSRFGESIYGTRPFVVHGHGPTKPGKGRHGGKATDIAYTSDDVRYTRKGNTVYAIVLGWPEAAQKETMLSGFAKSRENAPREIDSVTLLGSEAEIDFEMTEEGLKVVAPERKVDSDAIVYKITLKS